jgi:hypothetical protein
MFSAGFEPTIPLIEGPQTHTVDRSHRDRLVFDKYFKKEHVLANRSVFIVGGKRGERHQLTCLQQKNQSLDHWIRSRTSFFGILDQGCTNLGRQVHVSTTIYTTAPGTCFMSQSCGIEFWRTSYIFGKFLQPCIRRRKKNRNQAKVNEIISPGAFRFDSRPDMPSQNYN